MSQLIQAGHSRVALPWGFMNLDGLVHFHEHAGTDWLQIEQQLITGSGGYASAQTQTWSNDRRLVATSITQLSFFGRPTGS